MDLNKILAKNKNKSIFDYKRNPVSIATEERPYHSSNDDKNVELELESIEQNKNTLLDINDTQTAHNTQKKQTTNKTQTNHNLTTNYTQNSVVPQNIESPINKLNTKQNTDHHTNYTQTTHKQNGFQNKNKSPINTLVGVQKKLLLLIFQSSLKVNSTISEELTIETIVESLDIKKGSVRTSIARLLSKNFITLYDSKEGRGGWQQFEIPHEIYGELIRKEFKSTTQTTHNLNTELNTELRTMLPSSSSNDINTTTNTKDDNFSFSDEWKYIDIEPLADIGFTESQLKQLARAGKLTPVEVQESIYAFAYARKQPEIVKSIRSNPLNFLMGILIKKGEPYLPPTGYKSPVDLAIQEDIERKKKKLELEAELNNLKFLEWYNFLAKEEKEKLFVQELTDEEKELYFGKNARHLPEHVRESKRKEVLQPYFFNKIQL